MKGPNRLNHRQNFKYEFNSKEEWRKSFLQQGFAGCSANEVYRQKGENGRIWYKNFKWWLEHEIITNIKSVKTYVFTGK